MECAVRVRGLMISSGIVEEPDTFSLNSSQMAEYFGCIGT